MDFEYIPGLHDLGKMLVLPNQLFYRVKTTPQMIRFRDVKVCNHLAPGEIGDHRIQSDYKCVIGLQHPEGKNSALGIMTAW